MTRTYIYAIVDPQSDVIRYIGQTTNLRKRFNVHMFYARKGVGQPIHVVMSEMIQKGFTPKTKILDEIDTPHKEVVYLLERCWVLEELRNGNFLLCNERADVHWDFTIDLKAPKIKSLVDASPEDVENFCYSGDGFSATS